MKDLETIRSEQIKTKLGPITIHVYELGGKFHANVKTPDGASVDRSFRTCRAAKAFATLKTNQFIETLDPANADQCRESVRSETKGEYQTEAEPAAWLLDDDQIIARALKILTQRLQAKNGAGKPMTSPQATRDFLRLSIADKQREHFCVMFLDTRHRLISFETLFKGTIDSAHVHPRVVVKRALELNAAAAIVSHNHPSGIAEPSQADLAITRRLRDALGLVDIRLLDHFIVGEGEVVSLAERGLV